MVSIFLKKLFLVSFLFRPTGDVWDDNKLKTQPTRKSCTQLKLLTEENYKDQITMLRTRTINKRKL